VERTNRDWARMGLDCRGSFPIKEKGGQKGEGGGPFLGATRVRKAKIEKKEHRTERIRGSSSKSTFSLGR